MDLGSLNKTVVKGKEYIQKNLMTGGLINLGETRLRFVWTDYLAWRREHGVADDQPGIGDTPEPDQGAEEPG
jgi:hypothetical protein